MYKLITLLIIITLAISLNSCCCINNFKETQAYSNASDAKVYEDNGEHEKALKHYQKAIKYAPDNASLHNNICWDLTINKYFDDARPYCEKALLLDPDDPYVLDSMGYLLVETGEVDEGIKYYEKSIKIDPAKELHYIHLADAYIDKGDFNKAFSYVDKALEVNSEYYFAYYKIGLYNSFLKKSYLAIENYKKAINLNSNYTRAYYKLATELEKIGKQDEAREYLEQVAEIENNLIEKKREIESKNRAVQSVYEDLQEFGQNPYKKVYEEIKGK